jgi:hypothetical protein
MRKSILFIVCCVGLVCNAIAVQWVGTHDLRPVLCDDGRTGVFELIGITFPGNSPAERKRLATRCGATDESMLAFVPTIPDLLNVYTGRTVTVRGKRGRAVWLVDDNGTEINADIVRRGLVLAPRTGERKYVDKLKEAEREAARTGAGMWALEPRTDPTLALRFDYESRTDKETVSDLSEQYSWHRTNDKTVKHTRVVELKVDASAAKRRVDLVIHYQFKKATYDGRQHDDDKRDLVFTAAETMRESILPGEVKTITLTSPSVESRRHFDSSGSEHSYKRGEEFVGDVVVVKCGERELFSHGALKAVASSQ